MKESRLDIDGHRLSYFNAQASAEPFRWPGQSGPPQAKLSISIINSADQPSTRSFDSEWSLFRLLGLATVAEKNPITYIVSWPLRSSDGRRFDVRYILQSRNAPNPFALDFFSRVRCPEHVTRGPAGTAAAYSPVQ